MGARGPLAKPAEIAQGHRARSTTTDLVPAQRRVAPAKRKVPPVPKGVTSRTVRGYWRTYWQSDIAQAALDVDMPLLTRLFTLYQKLEDLLARLDSPEALTTAGSQGQLVRHPWAAEAEKYQAQILKLENEIGATPYSRARLGIAVGQYRMTLQELNAMAEVDGGGSSTGLPEGVVLEGEWEFV